ncbi:hypothetical protein CO49_2705 [Staphylococcus aureus subsp. aureus CO-49]|nr:hypothetical protein CO49_2705 [Staphylococcus aureus subsp. aureus CO-49]
MEKQSTDYKWRYISWKKINLSLICNFFADQSDDPDEPGGDGKKGNPDKKEYDEGTEITFTPEQQKKVDEILERRVAHEKKKLMSMQKKKQKKPLKKLLN